MENDFHLICENFAYLYIIKQDKMTVFHADTSITYFNKTVLLVNTIQEKN